MASKGRRKIGRIGSMRIFVEGDTVILGVGASLSPPLGPSERKEFEALYRVAEHEAETAAEMGGRQTGEGGGAAGHHPTGGRT